MYVENNMKKLEKDVQKNVIINFIPIMLLL